METLPVIAVVDARDQAVIVWHVGMGKQMSAEGELEDAAAEVTGSRDADRAKRGVGRAMSRLTGAWVLGVGEVDVVHSLVSGRYLWLTVGAKELLAIEATGKGPVIDIDALTSALIKEKKELERRFLEHQAAAPSKRKKLVRPSFTSLKPFPAAAEQRGERTVDIALARAKWFAMFADRWDEMNSQRSRRPYVWQESGLKEIPMPIESCLVHHSE